MYINGNYYQQDELDTYATSGYLYLLKPLDGETCANKDTPMLHTCLIHHLEVYKPRYTSLNLFHVLLPSASYIRIYTK